MLGNIITDVWPDESKMPGFQKAAKNMGILMREVATLLSKHIDIYVEQRNVSYKKKFLYNLLKDTEKVKSRLLYYFPLEEDQIKSQPNDDAKASFNSAEVDDSWIGWHNDSGFLTALAGEMYINDDTGTILEESPDPNAGLYVINRSGQAIPIKIPFDCMAIQLGECVQIITGGDLIATPHCVRGVCSSRNSRGSNQTRIARISHVCFIDTVPTFPLFMPDSVDRESVLNKGVESDRIPSLGNRWVEVSFYG